jgi:hypothetical protein
MCNNSIALNLQETRIELLVGIAREPIAHLRNVDHWLLTRHLHGQKTKATVTCIEIRVRKKYGRCKCDIVKESWNGMTMALVRRT